MGWDSGEHAGLAQLAGGDPAADAPAWATALAGGLPLLYYAATASGFGYWLDAGELVAASRTLGIAHPPGQALSALYHGLFAILPLGPLSFRVALASALAMAVALAFTFRATYHGLSLAGLLPAPARALASVAATWSLAAGVGVWLQAVRPEVYALQAALSAVVLDGLVRSERDAPDGSLSALRVAAFAEGLALANHHFLGLLLLPAAAPSLARVLLRRGARALLPVAGFALLGLFPYAYLPLRALAHPTPNFGDPSSPGRFLWVVSARAFQHTHAISHEAFGSRMADVGVAVVETLGWPALLLAASGLVLALQKRATRRLGVLWLWVLLAGALARGWLGFVRHNPDALGYLAPVYVACAALSAFFVAALLRVLAASPRVAVGVCGLLLALSLLRLDRAARAQDLSRFDATEHFDRLGLRALPARSVVLLFEPQSVFNALGQVVERDRRRDLTVVPLPLLAYPGMREALLAEAPVLAPLLDAYLRDGQLRKDALEAVVAQRPLFVELDPRIALSLYGRMVPEGLGLQRVLDRQATPEERLAGTARATLRDAQLYAALGAGAQEPRTRERLLWQHYTRALYYLGVGEREAAAEQLERGLRIAPRSEELRAMQAALTATRFGPVDVRPFVSLPTPRRPQ